MKYIVTLSIFVLFVSSCAKVTDEHTNCTKPSKPIISDMIISPSLSDANLNAQYDPGSLLIWISPSTDPYQDNSVREQVYTLHPNYNTNTTYGRYKVLAYKDGCYSDTTYFIVSPGQLGTAGSPSCTISTPNTLMVNGVNYATFAGSATASAGQSVYSIYASNGRYSISVEFPSYVIPAPGYYYRLDYSSSFYNGMAYAVIRDTYSSYSDYTSYGGTVYVTNSGGHNYLVFCNSVFQSQYSSNVGVMGSIQF